MEGVGGAVGGVGGGGALGEEWSRAVGMGEVERGRSVTF